ncbi:MAG: alanyl-tRNA editing protein [Methanothrix sp.]|jgi:Ala-tRNA(Pro) hydrolase (EC 3.1.1.-)|uniref:Ala-tRNA(Pro) hydrolase n=1 Tax=Methanothrix thermoacetophila (strain DSM 6194 / JCM 14653 / NBRC 101360 / PT) TaxID=349307 RepID=A0B9J9_METTP|nr:MULTISPECIES: alanyl-tRNA editing protein AlaXM [Methanothrix]ABK15373.1 Ala-tRNA(Pro) hydrolase [Methanothrix thermoacetophila PT]MBC7080074.1 alanyl-tRNA editing protein [Methanothrix sp.]NPU88312.1 alanyl-tRNA editing protein [Methanothrix sp.]
MTEALYLNDSYMRSFDAVVTNVDDTGVYLDRTAFYPRSGGQPSDLGVLIRGDQVFRVEGVEPSEHGICHRAHGLSPGDKVKGEIDWERRYRIMRSHTACHVLSAVIFRETGALITGNQIDTDRSRVDFSLESFDRSMIETYVRMANDLIKEGHPVRVRLMTRDEAMEIPDLVRLAKNVPERESVRVIEIEGVDLQACGGTHVRNTSEIGEIRLVKAENKGKSNRRVYFELVR